MEADRVEVWEEGCYDRVNERWVGPSPGEFEEVEREGI